MTFQERRAWFDDYLACEKMDLKVCPCCGYPTLSEPWGFEICCLCDWEADGLDDEEPETIIGSPNDGYSMAEARDNFVKYGWMYRKPQYDEKAVVFVNARVTYDLKQEMIHYFEKMIEALPEERDELWEAIYQLEKRLVTRG